MPRSRPSCSCFVRNFSPGPKPLHLPPYLSVAPEEAAERTARHLAGLRRLGELGMELAERAAQHANEAAGTPAEPATRIGADLAFARLSRCIQATYALEARLVAGKIPDAPRDNDEDHETANDPRRPAIKNFLLELIDTAPHARSIKAGFRNQLDPLITEGLADDPAQEHPPGAIVLAICEELGLECSPSQMPDDLLRRPRRAMNEAEKAAVAATVYRRIHGHDPPH